MRKNYLSNYHVLHCKTTRRAAGDPAAVSVVDATAVKGQECYSRSSHPFEHLESPQQCMRDYMLPSSQSLTSAVSVV